MNCINCGRELPPDTAECPYCLERDRRRGENKKERRKILVTLVICVLVLGVVGAAFLIFQPDSSFSRSMEGAESSYRIAELCAESPDEAADSRYQLILLDAADDIENRYSDQSCGYNQTVTAISQIYSVPNNVVRDRAEEVWSNVERMRFFQILGHRREETGVNAAEWNADLAKAAEALADEYAESGEDFEQNAERLIKNILPERDISKIKVITLINTINCQDALQKYEDGSGSSDSDALVSGDISLIGIDAVYSSKSGLWSFFIIAENN